MTTDAGMTVSDLLQIGESFRSLSSQNVQFVTVPNEPWTQNADRVQFMQPQASQVFAAIARDKTLPTVSTSPTPSATGGAQTLTTSPAQVKVKILNGSGYPDLAAQAATGLTTRGFDVTGTGDAPSSAYTTSVIEYASAADLGQVNTLEQQLSHVTDKLDASLAPGSIELILGADFTGLTPASASASPSTSPTASPSASPSGLGGLASSNGGITAAAACTSDGSAFAGPLSP